MCILLTSVFISSSQVLRSMRLTIKATCPMNLANFPMDDQMCTVSFALAKKDLFWWSHWTKFSSFTQMYYHLYFFVCWVVSLLPAWPQYKSFQGNCVSSYLNLQAICILICNFWLLSKFIINIQGHSTLDTLCHWYQLFCSFVWLRCVIVIYL